MITPCTRDRREGFLALNESQLGGSRVTLFDAKTEAACRVVLGIGGGSAGGFGQALRTVPSTATAHSTPAAQVENRSVHSGPILQVLDREGVVTEPIKTRAFVIVAVFFLLPLNSTEHRSVPDPSRPPPPIISGNLGSSLPSARGAELMGSLKSGTFPFPPSCPGQPCMFVHGS